MAGLRDEIDLDIASALRQVDRLGASLTQQAQKFRKELADSLDVLRGTSTGSVKLKVDTGDVRNQIAAAAGDRTATVTVAEHGVQQVTSEFKQLDGAQRKVVGNNKEIATGIRSIGALGLGYLSVRSLRVVADGLLSVVNASSDLAESQSKANVVFGTSVALINKFATTADTTVLLSKQAALETAATFGNLFRAIGLTQGQAAKLAPTVVQLGADLASFNNLGVEDTLQRIRSGLVGEIEPLRQLGVSFNETQVAAKAVALDLAESTSQVSEAAKIQARWALILEQTTTAQGDVARTADGYANTQRRLAAATANLRAEVGSRLLPAMIKGANGVASLVTEFGKLPSFAQTGLLALLGIGGAVFGIGLAVVAVQRLTAALVGMGAAGTIAAGALRGLAVGGGVVTGLALILTLVRGLGHEAKSTADDVRDLARATDEELAAEFRRLTTRRPERQTGLVHRLSEDITTPIRSVLGVSNNNTEFEKRIGLEKRFQDIAKESLPLARSIRDVLAGQGEDVSRLNKVIHAEADAQARANANTGAAGGPTLEAAAAADKLDKALGKVTDTLDATFGRYVDSEKAQLDLRDAAAALGAELGEGRKKGESLIEFQNRLRTSGNSLANQVRETTLALAKSGDIGSKASDITGEMRAEFVALQEAFPELRAQLQLYIDQIDKTPTEKSTVFTAIFKTEGADAVDRAFDEFGKKGRTSTTGQKAGEAASKSVADGLLSGLANIGNAGRLTGKAAADAAVKEIETTLRRSGKNGLNIGGFIVEGLSLGGKKAEVELRNRINGLTKGLSGVVKDASKISADEASTILQAVQAADQAARDLAATRKKLGANSIEAKNAELALGAAQRKVNDAVVEALDSTKAYNEALDKVNAGIDTMTGSLRALNSLREAQRAASDARKDAAKEVDNLARFDTRISEVRRRLAEAQASGDPTDIRRQQATLADLVRRRGLQADKTQEAKDKEVDANLAVVDSQQQLIDLGAKVADAKKVWEGFFRDVATQAGLTKKAIDDLVTAAKGAGNIALADRTALLGGKPVAPNVALTPKTGVTAAGLPTSSVAPGTKIGVNIEQINVTETTSARGTAKEIVDEQYAAQLRAVG